MLVCILFVCLLSCLLCLFAFLLFLLCLFAFLLYAKFSNSLVCLLAFLLAFLPFSPFPWPGLQPSPGGSSMQSSSWVLCLPRGGTSPNSHARVPCRLLSLLLRQAVQPGTCSRLPSRCHDMQFACCLACCLLCLCVGLCITICLIRLPSHEVVVCVFACCTDVVFVICVIICFALYLSI
jgi:hypothetical protein